MDNPDNEMVLYLMLRAVDRFFKHHGRYPGKLILIIPNLLYHVPVHSHVSLCSTRKEPCGTSKTLRFTAEYDLKLTFSGSYNKCVLSKGTTRLPLVFLFCSNSSSSLEYNICLLNKYCK